MTQAKRTNSTRRWWIMLVIFGIVLASVAMILTPWNLSTIASHPHAAQGYAEALQRIEILRGQAPPHMNPLCQLQLMTHAKKVDRAIILVHGYTNCPQQFHQLGQRFYALGYNVLIAPLPHHGLANRMTEAHAQLTAEELADYADQTVDIAQGLGASVTMMGISAGAVTTAWAAQHRNDIDAAVIISPAFGFKQIPTPLTAAMMNIYTLLADSFEWWDPTLQAESLPTYAYPRYSRHALVQTLRLGFATQVDAQRTPLAAKKMLVVLNANDNSVNNALTMEIVKSWQAYAANLTTYEFEAALKLDHDLIDPSQPSQRIDTVYPRLIELITR
jgi:pimeloyl-ACP methyl ester carboxylesterase